MNDLEQVAAEPRLGDVLCLTRTTDGWGGPSRTQVTIITVVELGAHPDGGKILDVGVVAAYVQGSAPSDKTISLEHWAEIVLGHGDDHDYAVALLRRGGP